MCYLVALVYTILNYTGHIMKKIVFENQNAVKLQMYFS